MSYWDYALVYLTIFMCVALVYIAYGTGKSDGEQKALDATSDRVDYWRRKAVAAEQQGYEKGYAAALGRYPVVVTDREVRPATTPTEGSW